MAHTCAHNHTLNVHIHTYLSHTIFFSKGGKMQFLRSDIDIVEKDWGAWPGEGSGDHV